MQRIVFEEPYEFVPPYRGAWWPTIIQRFDLYKHYLRNDQGVVDFEVRHAERLRASLAAGHGIMLTPNHARPGDPIVMGVVAKEARTHVYAMASWHLFKQDWHLIHNYITTTWRLKHSPVANIRKGDDQSLIKRLQKSGCEINEHPFGYRSIHYIVESSPSKRRCFAEIQVRTIFEEGWSEIDHRTRYPYNIDDPLLGHQPVWNIPRS